ncbi:MAG: hypothetical protein KDJ15_07060 [Alphaproteobacteria bacterium]|nr:hypothetical protein [Alphaproteobacteria bacterium]
MKNMVMEIKIISFSKAEMKQAVFRQLLRGEEQGREFHIKTLEIENKTPITARVTLERVSGRVDEKTLDHGFLAAAMLRYCMDNKIPLPRKADKNLQIVNGLLSMFLSMETKE